MAVDDNYREVIRKSGKQVIEGDNTEYSINTSTSSSEKQILAEKINELSNSKHSELLSKIEEIIESILLSRVNEITLNDGFGSGFKASINKFGEIRTINQSLPSNSDRVRQIPYTSFMQNAAGSSDARVAGSLGNPIDFTIESDSENDIYINTLSFRISDVNASLNKFGNITELTNGIQLIYSNSQFGELILADSLKSNFNFVRLCGGQPSFGDGATAFQASNVSGNSEGYIPTLNFKNQFLLNFGLRIRTKTKDKLIIRVRDDISAIDGFDIFATGFKKIE